MKTLHTTLGLLIGGLAALTVSAYSTPLSRDNPTVVVGTFDSRAVAVAYVRSDAFDTYVRAQQADVARAVARAREAGDVKLAADLDALGPAMQKRTHEQGFGTAPVDEIIAMIAERLPEIADEAGVDVIVSKWALAYQAKTARFVDVTDLLAAEFDPDEATLKAIRETMRHEPVPLDKLDHDH